PIGCPAVTSSTPYRMSRSYFQHRGIPFPPLLYSPRALEAARRFPVEDDDVFNVTYQKSGTALSPPHSRPNAPSPPYPPLPPSCPS
uniref:Uncharacterized protein n=1 Tax=Phasianus colchicus TaxID=9054 RepID=A0A669QQI0_PHACC